MKKRAYISERTYKNYKNLFEKIKYSPKKLYYKNQLLKHEHNLKGTWSVVKEVIWKKKVVSRFHNKLIVDNKEITDTFLTAEKSNNYFAGIGPMLASKIPQTSKYHSQYINAAKSSLQNIEISGKELKTASVSLKRNKSSGYDDITANVVRGVCNEIQKILFYIFRRSFNEGVLKAAKITPIFK